tara:strand:+ start:630 stop:2441 length:1812 start_codon:yes stop_codon:yes gene_type:complete
MPLIDLKTDLKSLGFGMDRPGGNVTSMGSSPQPFPIPFTKDINDIKTEDLGQNGGTDFLVRGGLLAPVRSLQDASRLYQLFTKTPVGTQFTVKQNLLSRMGTDIDGGYPLLAAPLKLLNGPLNEGIYNPLNTLAQVLVNAGGIHLFKQGINPFTGGPKYKTMIAPAGAELAGIKNKKLNRLVHLYDSKISSTINATIGGDILFKYGGGPGSFLGIGPTVIKRASDRTPFKGLGKDGQLRFDTFGQKDLKNAKRMGDQTSVSSEGIFNLLGLTQTTSFPDDFRKELIDSKRKATRNRSIISKSPDYPTKNIEARVNFNNAGARGVDRSSYSDGRPDIPLGVDKINSLYLYRSQNVTKDKRQNDLVKFRIATIDNNNPSYKTFTHFRAFINSFTDSMQSQWNKFKYLGRGEDFLTYQGFTNTVTMNFTVAAQSKVEMSIMFQKLNFLKSTLAPDYSLEGYMRGNIQQLTLGGYFYEVPGVIESLTYTIPNDSTWEIGIDDEAKFDRSVKELPHRIEVEMAFTPIHKFLPRTVVNIDGKDSISQRFISLEDADGATANNLYAGEENSEGQYIGVPSRFQPDNHEPVDLNGVAIAEAPIPDPNNPIK